MEENRYKDVLKGIIEIIRNAEHSDIGFASICTYIGDHCPELKSEDERIRKWLLDFVQGLPDEGLDFRFYNVKKEQVVAWLEKVKDFDEQLEQAYKNSDEVQYKRGYGKGYVDGMVAAKKKELEKQAAIKDGNSIDPHFAKPITTTETKYPKFKVGDKVRMKEFESFPHICTVEDIDSDVYYCDFTNFDIVDQDGWELVKEPKFKVGDFIVNDYCMGRVVEITNDAYLLDTGQGISFSCEHNAHLWSISDAKDGDVLVCESKYGQEIGIVKQYVGKYGGCDNCFETYCFVDWDGIFRVGEYMGSKKIHPATKEQRNNLFKAMTDKGYTFDFEKKELSHKEVTKKSEQDSKWSEEDDKILCGVIDEIQANKSEAPEYDLKIYDKFLSWLKSIKDRVQPQPKQVGWSEEDKDSFGMLEGYLEFGYTLSMKDKANTLDWLKSIKQRLS